jgi:hypothetical protein
MHFVHIETVRGVREYTEYRLYPRRELPVPGDMHMQIFGEGPYGKSSIPINVVRSVSVFRMIRCLFFATLCNKRQNYISNFFLKT